MKIAITSITLAVLLSSCASLSTDIQLTHKGMPDGELLIYRQSAKMAAGEGMYIGRDDKYFVALDNGEYTRVKIDAGKHTIYAKAHASPAFTLEVNVEKGKTTCIKGAANPDVGVSMLLSPLGVYSVNHFILEDVRCPTEEQIKEYNLVNTQ